MGGFHSSFWRGESVSSATLRRHGESQRRRMCSAFSATEGTSSTRTHSEPASMGEDTAGAFFNRGLYTWNIERQKWLGGGSSHEGARRGELRPKRREERTGRPTEMFGRDCQQQKPNLLERYRRWRSWEEIEDIVDPGRVPRAQIQLPPMPRRYWAEIVDILECPMCSQQPSTSLPLSHVVSIASMVWLVDKERVQEQTRELERRERIKAASKFPLTPAKAKKTASLLTIPDLPKAAGSKKRKKKSKGRDRPASENGDYFFTQ